MVRHRLELSPCETSEAPHPDTISLSLFFSSGYVTCSWTNLFEILSDRVEHGRFERFEMQSKGLFLKSGLACLEPREGKPGHETIGTSNALVGKGFAESMHGEQLLLQCFPHQIHALATRSHPWSLELVAHMCNQITKGTTCIEETQRILKKDEKRT